MNAFKKLFSDYISEALRIKKTKEQKDFERAEKPQANLNDIDIKQDYIKVPVKYEGKNYNVILSGHTLEKRHDYDSGKRNTMKPSDIEKVFKKAIPKAEHKEKQCDKHIVFWSNKKGKSNGIVFSVRGSTIKIITTLQNSSKRMSDLLPNERCDRIYTALKL